MYRLNNFFYKLDHSKPKALNPCCKPKSRVMYKTKQQRRTKSEDTYLFINVFTLPEVTHAGGEKSLECSTSFELDIGSDSGMCSVLCETFGG